MSPSKNKDVHKKDVRAKRTAARVLKKTGVLKKSRLKQIAKAKREIALIETKTRELARNTLSAAEFITETVRAESRYFANLAVAKVTTKLTGHVHRPSHDASLDPLGGVPSSGAMDDPLSRRTIFSARRSTF